MPGSNPSLLEIFGPVMIGPSSSHTAGVARIAFLARRIHGGPFERALVSFYGSLASTWKGHGSDKAAVAGLLGILPEDERLAFAPELARREGLDIEIRPVFDGPERYHPNTAVIELLTGEKRTRVRGASIGGGKVRLQSVNGFKADLDGALEAILVLHRDTRGVIAGVSAILSAFGFNIASMVSHRTDKGDDALLVVELDGQASTGVLEAIRGVQGVKDVVYVPSTAPGGVAR